MTRSLLFIAYEKVHTTCVRNSEAQQFVQGICLEILLSFVNDMATRANDVGIIHSIVLRYKLTCVSGPLRCMAFTSLNW